MAIIRTGRNHRAKKELFQKGLQRGFLTIQEIETSLPPGSLTAAERWLLYYSLRAAEVEIRDEYGAAVSAPRMSEEELRTSAEGREEHAGERPESADGPSSSRGASDSGEADENMQRLDPAPHHGA